MNRFLRLLSAIGIWGNTQLQKNQMISSQAEGMSLLGRFSPLRPLVNNDTFFVSFDLAVSFMVVAHSIYQLKS